MRLMSFAMTTEQIRRREKHVTRRTGWRNLKPGTHVRAVVKGMGLRKGEKVQPLAELRIYSVTIEPLDRMLTDPLYGRTECILEGFPHLSPAGFVAMFCKANDCRPSDPVVRLAFTYVGGAL